MGLEPTPAKSSGKTLASWKEIAACLDVTVRTAQRWEKSAGLPAYRQGTGPKARVYAYEEELLAWRRTFTPSEEAGRRRPWFELALAVVVLAGAVAGIRCWLAPGEPRSWTLDGGIVRIYDINRKLCWQRDFGTPGPDFENLVQNKVTLADIDGDGRVEVLVSRLPEDLVHRGGSLLCLEGRGRLRWEFHGGRAREIGGREFNASYRVAMVRPFRLNGEPRLLVVSNHYLWYPSQVALLDPATGKLLGEYWHKGSLYQCVLHDLDGDGRPEALMAGINNPGDGVGHAALAVLKLPLDGTSRDYVLLPTADVWEVSGTLPIPNRLGLEDRRILMTVRLPAADAAAYYLDFHLRLLELRFSDGIVAWHRRLEAEGHLDHPFDRSEFARLAKAVHFAEAPDGNSPAVWQQMESGARAVSRARAPVR